MAGDERTGVCIMVPVAELDAGPVCLAGEEPILPEDTYGTLAERLARLAGELLIRTLDEDPAAVPQDDAGASYADKLTAADRLLDPTRPAPALERVIRALTPHIGARIATTAAIRSVSAPRGCSPPARRPVCSRSRLPRPVLGCAQGALELLEVQPAGRRWMSGEDYVRGLTH